MTSLLIKSVDRASGVSHDFVYDVGHVVEGTYLVKHCFVPNTCYNVNDYNRIFEVSPDNVVWTTISLTKGNYNASTLASEVATQLIAQNANFVVSVSSITGLLSISNAVIGFGLRFNSHSGLLLGFNPAITLYSGIPTTFIGSSVIQLGYAVSVGVEIDAVASHNYENGATKVSGAIYVPLNLDFGFYRSLPSGDFEQRITFRRARHLRIRLSDTSNGTAIDLNGGDFELLLARV